MQFNHQSLLTRNTVSSLLSVKATMTQGLKVQTHDHNLDLGVLEPVRINKHCDCNMTASPDLTFGIFLPTAFPMTCTVKTACHAVCTACCCQLTGILSEAKAGMVSVCKFCLRCLGGADQEIHSCVCMQPAIIIKKFNLSNHSAVLSFQLCTLSLWLREGGKAADTKKVNCCISRTPHHIISA